MLQAKLETARTLLNNIENLGSELECLVDVGDETYCTARVPDTSTIFIETVHGFFVAMTHEQAKKFLRARIEIVEERLRM